MIRIEIELSDSRMNLLDAAAWAAVVLNNELGENTVVHSITAQECDA